MDEVRDFLNETGLGKYAEKFEEDGLDDFETVLSMTEEDIKTCIDKPGHVRKLLLKLKSLLQGKCNRENNTLSDNPSSDAGTSVSVSDSETLNETVSPEHKETPIESSRITAKEQHEAINEALVLKSKTISAPDEDAANITGNQNSVTANTTKDHLINPDCNRNTTHATDVLRSPDVVDTEVIEQLSEEVASALDSSDIVNNPRRFDDKIQPQAESVLNKSQDQSAINYEGNAVTMFTRSPTPATCTVIENLTLTEKVHKTSESANKSQMKTILNHHKKKHEQLHVDTRAFQEAIDILDDRYWLVIVGNPGDGKTWMGHELLFHYDKRGYKPVIITSTDDWKRSVGGEGSSRQIALIDDIFGSISLDDRKVSDWISVLEDAEALVKARSGKLMVVYTSRKNIVEAVKSNLSKYKIIGELHWIDFTSLHKLMQDERNKFLQKYHEHYGVNFELSTIENVMEGFPVRVKRFCKYHKALKCKS